MTSPALENDHNVYILGAGFSRAAGFPLVREFMERMRDSLGWIRLNKREKEAQAIERVLAFRLKAAAAAYRTPIDPDNVEELFSLASAEGQETLDEDLRRAIAATLDFCEQPEANPGYRIGLGTASRIDARFDLGSWRVNNTPGSELGSVKSVVFGSNYQVLCAALAGCLSDEPSDQRKNTFITFNYELLVEQALSAAGYKVDYGFANDELETQVEWLGRGDRRIDLFKLHGSINWAIAGGDKVQRYVQAFENYDPIVEQGLAPLLVPPTWRKSFGGHLDSVWIRALQALRTATRVVVIGFSMPRTDQHFRYLVAAGLRENISLRQIVFVDPHVDDLQGRINEVFRPELQERGVLETWKCSAFDLLNTRLTGAATLLARLGRPLAADTWIHEVRT